MTKPLILFEGFYYLYLKEKCIHKCHCQQNHNNLPNSNVYEEYFYLYVEYYRPNRDGSFLSLVERGRTG